MKRTVRQIFERVARGRALLCVSSPIFEADFRPVTSKSRLIRMAFSSARRFPAEPLLLAKRTYVEWRNNNQDFARAKAKAIRHYGLPFEFFRLML